MTEPIGTGRARQVAASGSKSRRRRRVQEFDNGPEPAYTKNYALMERLITLAAKVPILLLLTMAAAVAIAGEYTAKRWSMQPNVGPFVLAICLYGMTGMLFMLCLPREKLIVAGLLYDILTNSSFLLLGFLVFHERLSRLQMLGAGFGILSLIIFVIAEAIDP